LRQNSPTTSNNVDEEISNAQRINQPMETIEIDNRNKEKRDITREVRSQFIQVGNIEDRNYQCKMCDRVNFMRIFN
jgi:hypothetical protein